MNVTSRIFAFYINSSIHVSLSVLALSVITLLEYGLSVNWKLWLFVFLGALTGYNFVKYAKIAGLHHRELAQSLKAIQIFSALCFVWLVYIVFQLPVRVIWVTACFGFPTLFYAVPIIRHKNLRSLAGIKIFVVALVWAGVTVIVPIIDAEDLISGDVWLTFFQRILIVVALILPFEIRDVPYDSLNLKTLPQQIGVGKTKLLGLGVLVLCVIFEFFKREIDVAYISSFLVFLIILGGMLVISKTRQSRYFSSFWVEGLPIFWCVLYLILRQV